MTIFMCRFLRNQLPLISCFVIIISILSLLASITRYDNILLAVFIPTIILLLFGLLFMTKVAQNLYTEIQQLKEELETGEKREVELKQLSYTDALTGIANRRAFEEQFSILYDDAVKHKESISLAIVDIDRFKYYNDTYGHLMGDLCLKHVSTAIQSEVGCFNHFIARYGGEEFIIIFPRTENKDALQITERIRKKIESLHIAAFNKETEPITVSIGVASIFPSPELKKEFLVKQADEALYEAKREGRNRVVYYGQK